MHIASNMCQICIVQHTLYILKRVQNSTYKKSGAHTAHLSPPKSPVSNTSARRGPGRNRTSETSLPRATPKPSHHTYPKRRFLAQELRCHRFVTLSLGPKCAKGLEKQSRTSDLAPGRSLVWAWAAALVRAWCGGVGLVRPGAGLAQAWFGPERAGAGLVRAWCGPGNPMLGTELLPQSCCGNRLLRPFLRHTQNCPDGLGAVLARAQ